MVGGEAITKVLKIGAIDKKTDRPRKPIIITDYGEVAQEDVDTACRENSNTPVLDADEGARGAHDAGNRGEVGNEL